MWLIFILAVIAIVAFATLVIVGAAWLVHKVSNAMIRDNRKLEKEETEHREGEK